MLKVGPPHPAAGSGTALLRAFLRVLRFPRPRRRRLLSAEATSVLVRLAVCVWSLDYSKCCALPLWLWPYVVRLGTQRGSRWHVPFSNGSQSLLCMLQVVKKYDTTH